VLVSFYKEVNALLCLASRLFNSKSVVDYNVDAAITTVRRSYIKNVKASMQKDVKHSLTKQPKSNKI
jgi:hypothetical protein